MRPLPHRLRRRQHQVIVIPRPIAQVNPVPPHDIRIELDARPMHLHQLPRIALRVRHQLRNAQARHLPRRGPRRRPGLRRHRRLHRRGRTHPRPAMRLRHQLRDQDDLIKHPVILLALEVRLAQPLPVEEHLPRSRRHLARRDPVALSPLLHPQIDIALRRQHLLHHHPVHPLRQTRPTHRGRLPAALKNSARSHRRHRLRFNHLRPLAAGPGQRQDTDRQHDP